MCTIPACQHEITCWAVCRKDLIDIIGGEILSAYCTCIAGLYGSCNHVAGLLFRVEAAVLTGLSNPTCKSVSAAWDIPKTKTQIITDEISKFTLQMKLI